MAKETKGIRVRYGARKDSAYTFSVSYLERACLRCTETKEKPDNCSGVSPKRERQGNICQTIDAMLKKIKESDSRMVIEIDAKFLSETVGVTEPIMRSYLFLIYSQSKRQSPLIDDAYV